MGIISVAVTVKTATARAVTELQARSGDRIDAAVSDGDGSGV